MSAKKRARRWVRNQRLQPSASGRLMPFDVLLSVLGACVLAVAAFVSVFTDLFTIERKITLP